MGSNLKPWEESEGKNSDKLRDTFNVNKARCLKKLSLIRDLIIAKPGTSWETNGGVDQLNSQLDTWIKFTEELK